MINPLPNPSLRITLPQPSKARWPPRRDLLPPPDHDEEVIPPLPHGVHDRRDPEAAPQVQMRDLLQGGVAGVGVGGGEEVD